MAYTQDGIMGQIWIVFGQGAGAIRVSHEAVMELHRWFYNEIPKPGRMDAWDTVGVQALERIRAIGSLAALKARTAGATAISQEDVYEAAATVTTNSDTNICPPVLDKP
jgi:hypothetical protein